MKALHAIKYGVNNRPEIRESAARSFRAWHGVSQVVNLLMVGGLAVYLWRAANPADPTRFVSAVKFTMRYGGVDNPALSLTLFLVLDY